MPARETSAWFPAILLQDKPSQLQYLQNYVPRRPDLPEYNICEGDIKDFNFAVCVDTSPRYFGIWKYPINILIERLFLITTTKGKVDVSGRGLEILKQ